MKIESRPDGKDAEAWQLARESNMDMKKSAKRLTVNLEP